jgi:protease-4
MKQFLITVAGVFVGLVLFMVGVPVLIVLSVAASARPAPITGPHVLDLDLRTGLTDQAPRNPFSALTGERLSVLGVEQGLRRAEGDSGITGLMVRLPEGAMAPAAADELALAFRRFRAAGKPILVYSQGLYADGTVISTYELAAASGNIWMQPASEFQVTGLARGDAFFKRFFDRHDIKPDFEQRNQYKTAINPFLYSDYTPAHRASELSWMGSVYDTALRSAAADRAQPAANLRTLIEAGPYSAEDAKAKGLIDQVGDLRDARAAFLGKAGQGAKYLDFTTYAAHAAKDGAGAIGGAKIAVISAEGDIMTGPSGTANPLGGGETIRSDEVSRAFQSAIDDEGVKAIVFRESSPGGSDTASEQILSAVRAAKAAGKPVVVTMGTYGASGGYWIASQASEIIAEPTTLTGSIGVFGGKFALGAALSKFGVDLRGIKVGGDFADALGGAEPMTPTQKAAFSAWMDRIYAGFIGRVAQGRKLPEARVREIANGRVWTGAQAKALGLVDGLGGFYQAVDRAKALAGIKGDARLETFDAGRSPLDAVRRMFGASSRIAGLVDAAAALATSPGARAAGQALSDADLRAQGATVLAPRWVR